MTMNGISGPLLLSILWGSNSGGEIVETEAAAGQKLLPRRTDRGGGGDMRGGRERGMGRM